MLKDFKEGRGQEVTSVLVGGEGLAFDAGCFSSIGNFTGGAGFASRST